MKGSDPSVATGPTVQLGMSPRTENNWMLNDVTLLRKIGQESWSNCFLSKNCLVVNINIFTGFVCLKKEKKSVCSFFSRKIPEKLGVRQDVGDLD